jgi:hypothetical protein
MQRVKASKESPSGARSLLLVRLSDPKPEDFKVFEAQLMAAGFHPTLYRDPKYPWPVDPEAYVLPAGSYASWDPYPVRDDQEVLDQVIAAGNLAARQIGKPWGLMIVKLDDFTWGLTLSPQQISVVEEASEE